MRIFDFIHPVQTVGAAAVGVGAVGSAFRPAKHFALAAGLAAALAAGGVVAAQPNEIARLPHTTLFTEVSVQHEPTNDFLTRIAFKLRSYSEKTGFEACAAIAHDNDGRVGVTVTTSHSHIACAVRFALLPDGMTATGETFHSHGGSKRFRMNHADKAYLSIPSDSRSAARAVVYGQDLDKFSSTDLAGLPGYLATPDGVIYHP